MVKLWCGMYGDGTVFSIEIDLHAKVSALQEAIFIKKRYDQRFSFHASALTLYVARKDNDGAWLKDHDSGKDFLVAGEIDKQYKQMRTTWKLDNEAYFGADFQPGCKEIHVLVELPQPAEVAAAMGSDSQGLRQLIESAVCKAMDKREAKQSAYALSELNSELAARIMCKLHLKDDYIDLKEPVDTSVAGYQWIPNVTESEASQRAGYMAYLRLHLKPLLDRGDFQLRDVAQDKSLLSIVDPRLPFRMDGTADVFLVNRYAKNPLSEFAGIRLVVTLKKQIEKCHYAQALGQLISCSLKAPMHCYPVSLLTDLNGNWHFSWFNQEHVVAHVTLWYPSNAMDFIVAAVSEKQGFAPYRVPLEIRAPLKKLTIDDFAPMPSDAADEMMERYELMADELEPEFLAERRAEYAQHLVQSMPMYAHMFADT